VKRISSGVVTIGVLAIVGGLVAAYAVRQAFNTETVARKGPTVVVARTNIPANTRIRATHVKTVTLPYGRTPLKGALANPAIAVGRINRVAIVAGDPIVEQAMYPVGDGPMLAEDVPAGYQALPIAVTGTGVASRMLLKGSFVDVLFTIDGKAHPELEGYGTKTLIRGVQVLHVGNSNTRLDPRRRRNGRVITVAVTPNQAKLLTLAQNEGTLSVALVSSQENVSTPIDGDLRLTTREQLLGFVRGQVSAVEIWKGGKKVRQEFTPAEIREAQMATRADEARARRRQTQTAAQPSDSDKAAVIFKPAAHVRPVRQANTPRREIERPGLQSRLQARYFGG